MQITQAHRHLPENGCQSRLGQFFVEQPCHLSALTVLSQHVVVVAILYVPFKMDDFGVVEATMNVELSL